MSRTTWELIIGIASITMFVGTLAAIPWLVRRLPPDYLVRPPPKHSLPVKIFRNGIGFGLVALGIAMLVLPGQGVITVLIGLSIIDLPIKHRVMKRLLQSKTVREGIQRLRTKMGKPPLIIPAHQTAS